MFRLTFGRVSMATAAAAIGGTSLAFKKQQEVFAAASPFDFKVTKEVRFEKGDMLNKKLTLFQFHSCPFCCKVRAYLDYSGINYDIVEVNSVFRTQVKWTNYKKVPIVIVRESDREDNYTQVNDSSVIISAIETIMLDTKKNFDTIITYYPSMEVSDQHTGKKKLDFPNRYAIMYESDQAKEVYQKRRQEAKWRKWVDEDFVHTLAPNIYRTPGEALAAFNYVSDVGGWEDIFSKWERITVIYVGAIAMYFIGKILARRHSLDKDVRESLYEGCRTWIRAMGKGPFKGGAQPDLSDLAVYGVLNSIEGCEAFRDAMTEVPKMSQWYNRMKTACQNTRSIVKK